MVVENVIKKSRFNLAGKCSLERKQAEQIQRLGFDKYELFISNPGELDNPESAREKLRENHDKLGMVCVSVHSPNSIISMGPNEVADYIDRCQDLVNILEEIQEIKPAGVVLHELRGKNYSDFSSKMSAFHEIFDRADENVNILIEPPLYKANGENKAYLQFPKYLDILVEEMKTRPNFGITFDIDHMYESALFCGLSHVYGPMMDLFLLAGIKNHPYRIVSQVYPGAREYLEKYVGSDTSLRDEKFDKSLKAFRENYLPILLDYELEALGNLMGTDKQLEDAAFQLTQMFGFRISESERKRAKESKGHPLLKGSSKYSEILSRMVERYLPQIKLFHLTGSDYRIGSLEEEKSIKESGKFDFVKTYGGIVYVNNTHTPFGDEHCSLDQQLPLLVYAKETPIVLEAMLDDETGKRYFENGSLLF